MTLDKCILIGLFGSFLMFLGDMTLYYDPNDYDGKDTINNNEKCQHKKIIHWRSFRPNMCLYIFHWLLPYCFGHKGKLFNYRMVYIFNKCSWHDTGRCLPHSMCLLRSFIKARKQRSF